MAGTLSISLQCIYSLPTQDTSTCPQCAVVGVGPMSGGGFVGGCVGVLDDGDRGTASVDLWDGGGVQPEAGAVGADDRSGGEDSGESYPYRG